MSQTTTPSDTDVLAILDAEIRALPVMAEMMRHGNHSCDERPAIENMKQARTAVAALIARNAELEAERDEALRRANRADARVKGWEATMVVRGLPRRIYPVDGWGPGEGETVEIPALTPQKLTEILGRVDALAAENKALREDAERWREIERRFDRTKTSEAERVLYDLRLPDDDPYKPLAEIIDAARTASTENDPCDSAT